MEAKILIPVDGSDTAVRTLEKIVALKERFPKELTLLHVVDVDKLAYRMIPDFQLEMVRENAGKAGKHVLDSKVAILEEAGFGVDARLEFGPTRQTICKIANDETFDLMIIGRRESTGEIRDVLFGSVANYVLHNVACPVLLF
ncbi:MAG: universal stress protein [Desulfuromonadales bacterium]|jgi:nucleotide-binding universal stress UspA family protein|nr:universal stress protein [Desulfuromonadales bacterium]